jgi:hypothetical protein
MPRFKTIGRLWRSTKPEGKAKASGYVELLGQEVKVLLMPNEKRGPKDADFVLVHVVEDAREGRSDRTADAASDEL